MRKPDPDPPDCLLGSAVGQALADARWERLDLLNRRPAALVPDLLIARADELAASPRGRDQLLAIALERVAHGDRSGAGVEALLGPAPTDADRLALHRIAGAAGDRPVRETRAFVEALEARHAQPGRRRTPPAEALAAEASLNELLWDDPRIRADDGVRLIMLCSVRMLRDRVERRRATPARMVEVAARLPLIGQLLRSWS